MWYTHAMEYYSAMKKNETLPFATWKEMEGITLSEISQSEKDRYHMISLMWNLRNLPGDHRRREGKIRYKQRGRQTIRDSWILKTN